MRRSKLWLSVAEQILGHKLQPHRNCQAVRHVSSLGADVSLNLLLSLWETEKRENANGSRAFTHTRIGIERPATVFGHKTKGPAHERIAN